MDRLKIITILISVVALGVATYALVSLNRFQYRVITAEEADVDLSRSESRLSQATGAGIGISRSRLRGAGAVELRRENRLDLFGGLEDEIFVPIHFFDLSPADEDAANKLTAALVAPSTVHAFRPFSISWEVRGPGTALSRVNSYQINVFSFGPIFGLSPEATLTPDGLKAQGSVIASMWQSGSVRLWARFGSGIRELEVTEVTVDLSDCSDESVSLVIATLFFQNDGGTRFVEAVQEEAGEDVTVTVLTDAVATFSSDGFTFHIKLKLEDSGASIVVDLGMQFMIVPRQGHLGASFASSGFRSVDIDPDLPWYDDTWHFITLGEHNLFSYYARFSNGLKELADGFASAIGRQVRGLPDPDDENYDTLEAEAPKAVATAIDISSEQLIVTLCPINSRLVSVGGIFPEAAVKIDQ